MVNMKPTYQGERKLSQIVAAIGKTPVVSMIVLGITWNPQAKSLVLLKAIVNFAGDSQRRKKGLIENISETAVSSESGVDCRLISARPPLPGMTILIFRSKFFAFFLRRQRKVVQRQATSCGLLSFLAR